MSGMKHSVVLLLSLPLIHTIAWTNAISFLVGKYCFAVCIDRLHFVDSFIGQWTLRCFLLSAVMKRAYVYTVWTSIVNSLWLWFWVCGVPCPPTCDTGESVEPLGGRQFSWRKWVTREQILGFTAQACFLSLKSFFASWDDVSNQLPHPYHPGAASGHVFLPWISVLCS